MITFDYYMGKCDLVYKKKEPDDDGHYWIAYGKDTTEFDQALKLIGAYDEYYSQFNNLIDFIGE